jgi:hypothetical protein
MAKGVRLIFAYGWECLSNETCTKGCAMRCKRLITMIIIIAIDRLPTCVAAINAGRINSASPKPSR